jgi:hypothetical protein
MRVVLDTNVLVSAALKQKSMPGMAALVVERCGGLLKSLTRSVVPSLREAERRSDLDRLSTTGARLLRFARNDAVSRGVHRLCAPILPR